MPLDLTRGQAVGVDPELQVHMDEVASARSARSSGMSYLFHSFAGCPAMFTGCLALSAESKRPRA